MPIRSSFLRNDIDRVKSHLAKYYKKMGEDAPWDRD
jgi:hypothetical protein